MDNSYSQQLIGWVQHYKSYTVAEKAASYIPALAQANPSDLGICLIAPHGEVMRAGQWNTTFTLQSVSKVINFMAACLLTGIPSVLERVDVEPTGDAFNSIIRLESHHPGKPFNPMINAGAITVASILTGTTAAEKLEYFMKIMEQLMGKRPTINQQVYQSEWETAYRNRAIAYYLKGVGYLDSEVDVALEVYLKQCSIEATTEDLALIGLILAHDGFHPLKKKQLFPKEIARLAKSLMVTCGMYNASGKFAASVGIPAKSGVSGAILACALPKRRNETSPFPEGCGIGVYGPAIDDVGNSKAGIALLEQIAGEWDFSIF